MGRGPFLMRLFLERGRERARWIEAEAETLMARLIAYGDADPRLLEQVEERLFALRAAARKHGVPVTGLADLRDDLERRLAALDYGEAEIDRLVGGAKSARAAYADAAGRLSVARQAAAGKLQIAMAGELPPLRLEKARFAVEVSALPEAAWGAAGADAVRFLIATNPGQVPGPLAKIDGSKSIDEVFKATTAVLNG